MAAGYPREAVEQVVRLIRINEYKRRQAAAGAAHHDARVRARLALSRHQRVPRIRRLAGEGAAARAAQGQQANRDTHVKQVTAIIKPFKLDEVREALAEASASAA